ncbi:MAG: DUF5320 domain-containing protein [Deltaproteobacteria bacterium]|nr:DUF5320 domain-containing protein [Deltaproteobacteria bacterium]
MPGHDQTGPMGYGPRTGRDTGFCAGDPQADDGRPNRAPGLGQGFNRSYGFGGGRGRGNRARRGRFFTPINPQDEKSLLDRQKEALKNRLNIINQRIEAIDALNCRGSETNDH